jgi:hypothetical protein
LTPDLSRLGELAEELAQLSALGTPEAAGQIGLRVREEAERRGLAPWALTHWVAQEWDRLGIVRVPAALGRLGS